MPRLVGLAQKKPGHGKHRLYAEIYDSDTSERISFGWNHAGRSDLISHYARNEKVDGTCAEAAAIIAAMSRYRTVVGSTVLVARARRERRGGPIVPGLARPCEGCIRLLKDFKVKEVIYTTDDPNHIGRIIFDHELEVTQHSVTQKEARK